MRNKKLIYILVPAVFVVWGLIAYKIVIGLKKNTKYQERSIAPSNKPIGEDTVMFKLLENYRDPFLGTTINNENTNVVKSIKKAKKNEPIDFIVLQQANEIWSQTNYGGLISGVGQKQELGLLSIKGKKYLLQKGQNIENIKVEAFYKDSAKLCFNGLYKTILKKK